MKRRALLVVFLAVVLSACGGKKRVVTEPHAPDLAPPPPPERVVVQQPAVDTGEQPGNVKEKQKTDKETNAAGSAKPAKPAPPTPPPVVEPPPPPPPEQKPPSPLQMGDPGDQKREADQLLVQAEKLKDKARQNAQSSAAKQQYDAAVSFIRLANQALAENNFSLGLRHAKNAVTILSALANR